MAATNLRGPASTPGPWRYETAGVLDGLERVAEGVTDRAGLAESLHRAGAAGPARRVPRHDQPAAWAMIGAGAGIGRETGRTAPPCGPPSPRSTRSSRSPRPRNR